MPSRSLLLILCVLPATVQQQSNLLPPYATLAQSLDGGATFPQRTFIQVAAFGGSLDAAAAAAAPAGLAVRLAAGSGDGALPLACSALPPVPPATAILASRGNCSFTQKAAMAQAAGAAALLVYDGLAGKYLASLAKGAPLAAGACDLDCAALTLPLPAARATLAEALGGYPDLCSGSAARGCASGLCALAPPPAGAALGGPRQLCCVPNDYLLVGGSASSASGEAITIPVAWLTAGDGAALARAAATAASADQQQQQQQLLRVLPALRALPRWDVSGVVLWGVGTACAALASYAAGAGERKALAAAAAAAARRQRRWQRRAAGDGNDADAEGDAEEEGEEEGEEEEPDSAAQGVWGGGMAVETLELTPRGACIMLCIASAFLFGLYLLSIFGVPIVYLVIAMFCIGSVGALANVLLLPVLYTLARRCSSPTGSTSVQQQQQQQQQQPHPLSRRRHARPPMPWLLALHLPTPRICMAMLDLPPTTPALTCVAYSASAASVAAWFFTRHGSAAYLAQNVFGACLCISAVSTISLTSLRSATLLLCALFCYDVFMVFGTPLLLPSGQSVMVEVATAGAPSPIPAAGLATPACYCRLFPGDSRVCAPGELMPILFAMPRFSDWRGGYSMLGLGDVVVPALALAVALRFEYGVKGRGRRGGGRRGAAGRGGGVGGEEEGVGLLAGSERGEEVGEGALAGAAPAAAAGTAPGATPAAASSSGSMSPRRRAVSPDALHSTAFAAATAPPSSDSSSSSSATPAFPCPLPSLWALGVAGYAVGLACAQVAVVVMQLGQPALLYLVPCVLLPITGAAWQRGQLEELWRGLPEQAPRGGAGSGARGGGAAGGVLAVGEGEGGAGSSAAPFNSSLNV